MTSTTASAATLKRPYGADVPGWTEERVELLKRNRRDKISDSVTAEMLGITRGAVWNKADSLGLPKQGRHEVAARQKQSAHPHSPWTDERVEMLKQLWAEGKSAEQIAGRIGGVSRNAVIGKVHRLGLSGRRTTSRAKAGEGWRAALPAQRMRPIKRPEPAAAPIMALAPSLDPDLQLDLLKLLVDSAAPAVEVEVKGFDLLDLKDNMCRWGINDPKRGESFRFCGCKTNGRVYCDDHWKKSRQPLLRRSKPRPRPQPVSIQTIDGTVAA